MAGLAWPGVDAGSDSSGDGCCWSAYAVYALVGVAAFGGILMNVSFLLSGSTSTNPVLLILGIFIVLAWKVAGWIGLDRYLLPLLGTPWQRDAVLGGPAPPVTTPRAPATR